MVASFDMPVTFDECSLLVFISLYKALQSVPTFPAAQPSLPSLGASPAHSHSVRQVGTGPVAWAAIFNVEAITEVCCHLLRRAAVPLGREVCGLRALWRPSVPASRSRSALFVYRRASLPGAKVWDLLHR